MEAAAFKSWTETTTATSRRQVLVTLQASIRRLKASSPQTKAIILTTSAAATKAKLAASQANKQGPSTGATQSVLGTTMPTFRTRREEEASFRTIQWPYPISLSISTLLKG